MSAPSVVVVGQLARDLVLVVDAMPAPGAAADVRSRREVLGGKGANQAVGLAQLGVPVALVAVAGDDGAPPADHRDALLATADVIRADARETELLTGVPGDDPERVGEAAADLLAAGPKLAVLAVAARNLFVWDDSHLLVPLLKNHVVDTTGAGDALVAGLTAALVRGDPPQLAARYAVAASAATVRHPGGRPDLTPATMAACLAEVNTALDRASP